MPPTKNYFRIVLFFVVLLFIVPGIVLVVKANTDFQNWESVPATLVNSTGCGKRGKNQELQYIRMWYNFETLDGQNITARLDDCEQDTSVGPVGSTNTILYNPEDPSVGVTLASVQDHNQYVGIGLILGGLAAVVVCVMCLKRKSPSQPQEGEDIPK